jgi:hypothetical protein
MEPEQGLYPASFRGGPRSLCLLTSSIANTPTLLRVQFEGIIIAIQASNFAFEDERTVPCGRSFSLVISNILEAICT